VNFNVETLVRSAATHGVGLVIKFVPFSEMLRWENSFNQDTFDVIRINKDINFLERPIRHNFAPLSTGAKQSIEGAVMVGPGPIGDSTTTAHYLGACSNDVIALSSVSEAPVLAATL
jgi:hypothetical protein